ncbi:alpha/beta hydrolase [Streptomyces sp. NPDC004096]
MGLRGWGPAAVIGAAGRVRSGGRGRAAVPGPAHVGSGEGDRTGEGERRRPRPGRLRRTLLAALVTGAVVVPLSAAVRPRIPAPAPAALAPLSVATLTTTYRANRADAAEASRMAAAHGDRGRAAKDRALASLGRDLLAFDGRGTGRVTEVFGDLATARRIAVLVPGSDTTLDTFDRLRTGAQTLHRAVGGSTAVIAWLGYDTPRTLSTGALTTTGAERAAPLLERFVGELRGALGPAARISLLCHSYGTVVCARAASADVQDVVLLGSPGTGLDSVADLHTRARVWAGRGTGDWIAGVPHLRADLFGTTVGFGTDPVSPDFGARVFAAGDGGHSDYFAPASVCLADLARIVLGRTSEVPRA